LEQWEAYGPEGTITDDTRFKLIFFNTLKANKSKLTQKRFAQAVLDFRGTLPPAYQKHYDTEVRRKRWQQIAVESTVGRRLRRPRM